MAELKPCPFCGGEAEISTLYFYGKTNGYVVYCKGCEMQTTMYSSKQIAAKHWNRRYEPRKTEQCFDKQNHLCHCESCHEICQEV